MALFKPYKITSDKLEDLAIQEGQIIITIDTKKLYVDVSATERIEVTSDAEVEDVTLASLGVTATAEELNYVDGVTSSIQAQLNNKAAITHNHAASAITSGTFSLDRIPTITDAKISGLSASKLTGTIPTANLPSYVDDVVEGETTANFPEEGETGKIYVATSTNKTYRWSGSGYVEISASLALGTTSSTAFRGDYGNTAYTHATAKGSAFASGLYKITTNAQGHVTAATAVTKADITGLGIPAQDTNTNTTYTLSKSGSTITLTGSDGSKTSVADANTTYSLSSFGVTATAAELNKLDGVTATAAEINYLDGVTSSIQSQLNTKAGLVSDKTDLKAGDDLNDFDTIGTYRSASGTITAEIANIPNGTSGAGFLLWVVSMYGKESNFTGTVLQIFMGGASGNTPIWIRRGGAGAWSAWQEVYTSTNKPTAAEIGAAASSHTHSNATTSAAGFLPKLGGGTTNYLRADGTWAKPPDTNTTYTLSSFGITATAAELNKLDGVTTTATQLNYLNTLTGNVQTQLNGKAASSHSHSYLPLAGGTLTGRLTANGRISAPTSGGAWTTGMTVTNATLGITTTNTSGSYHPIIACKTYGGHFWNLGTITNAVGFYGFKSGRTANGTDWAFTIDVTTGNVNSTNQITAPTFVGALSGNATTATTATQANYWTTARTLSFTGNVTGSVSVRGNANMSCSLTIANGAVTTARIADNAVTAAKIAADAVGTSEIAANAVTASEIASGAVGLSELSSAVGTVAVQSATPTDSHVKLWIKV